MSLTPVKNEIKKVIAGKDDVIDMVLCALLAKGHILLEDIPGVGKTTLAIALSAATGMTYKRMQFTPDVLPSDILGFSMYDSKSGDFVYREGAIFTNLFLADEINRTSPKTQSALLEAMEEGRVSVDGVTRIIEPPFFVIATQNPLGAAGTQRLPDSQLDRFSIRLCFGYPDHDSATEILQGKSSENLDAVQNVVSTADLLSMQKQVEDIFVDSKLFGYIVQLTEKSRESDYLSLGLSPRASIAILKMAKAHAFYRYQDFVSPEDIHGVFYAVTNHRMILSTKGKSAGLLVSDVTDEILRDVPLPGL